MSWAGQLPSNLQRDSKIRVNKEMSEATSRSGCPKSVQPVKTSGCKSPAYPVTLELASCCCWLINSCESHVESQLWWNSSSVFEAEQCSFVTQNRFTRLMCNDLNMLWWWCILLQQYRIHMDIGNSKNYLGISVINTITWGYNTSYQQWVGDVICEVHKERELVRTGGGSLVCIELSVGK